MRRIASILAALTLLLSQTAWAGFDDAWETIEPAIATDSKAKVEVVEFFWYGCPHCYALDPVVEDWKKTLPEGVVFRHVPAAVNPSWLPHSYFFYAAELLGVADKLHEPLFNAMHKDKRRIYDKEALISFAVENGVDEAKMRKAWRSFAVNTKVQRANKLAKRFRINGVPNIGVNGKYLTNGQLAGNNQKMMRVVDHLIQAELKGVDPE
jgi:thiol:disulfide interchange protein DsbA